MESYPAAIAARNRQGAGHWIRTGRTVSEIGVVPKFLRSTEADVLDAEQAGTNK
jgi:hypothetical protein